MVSQPASTVTATRGRCQQSLPPASAAHLSDARIAVKYRRLEYLSENVRSLPPAVTLQQSLLTAAGIGNTSGGLRLQGAYPSQVPQRNGFRTRHYEKWVILCSKVGIDRLDGSEGPLPRYLGWLFDESLINAWSVRNNLSPVTTAHTLIGGPSVSLLWYSSYFQRINKHIWKEKS